MADYTINARVSTGGSITTTVTSGTTVLGRISTGARGPQGIQGDTGPAGADAPSDHTLLTNIGTNTHAQIDTAIGDSVSHIANTSNPHSVTKAQVGLSNVPDTDFTADVAANTAKISFDAVSSARLANTSGTNTGDQDLSGYSLTSHNHTGVYAPVLGADDNYVTDAEKVVIGNTSGTNTGDNAVNSNYSGLAASKQDTLVSATNIKTINSTSLLGSGDIAISTTDATKLPLAGGTMSGTINTQNLLPATTATYSLGDSSHYYSNAYTTRLYLNSTAYLDGGTAGAVGITGNVGIGTGSPTSKLNIVDSTADTANPTFTVINNNTGIYNPMFGLTAPNAINGSATFFTIGKSASSYNRFSFVYNHIADGSTSNYFSIGAYSANGLLNILANGNVGIGTTTPDYKLQVNGTIAPEADSASDLGAPSLYFANTYTDRLYLNATAYIDGSTAGQINTTGKFWVGRTSVGNAQANTAISVYDAAPVQANAAVLSVRRGNAPSNGNTIGYGLSIQRISTDICAWYLGADTSDNAVFASNSSDIRIGKDISGTFTEYMRILNANGNVGIGTTAPNEKLTVAGAISITDGITAPSATSGYAKIYVDTADGDLKVIFGDGTVKTIATDT